MQSTITPQKGETLTIKSFATLATPIGNIAVITAVNENNEIRFITPSQLDISIAMAESLINKTIVF